MTTLDLISDGNIYGEDRAGGFVNCQQSTEPDSTPITDRYEPFPLDALPDALRGFVVRGAQSIGCDPAYIVLPMLSALAAAIGNTRLIELKPGWTEPSIIWTAIVGESGTMKSPALALALQPTRDRQSRAMTDHAAEVKEQERERLYYERDLKARTEVTHQPSRSDTLPSDSSPTT